MMNAWGPWVREAVLFLDSEGTFRHWKFAGAFADQPVFDIDVYQAARSRWIELVNEKRRRA